MMRTALHKLTPEERKIRSVRYRLRFRATARLAFANSYWLGDLSGAVLGDDVAKNVRVLTQRSKKKSKLELEQKRIMNKQKHLRTEEERANLHRVLGGLKCFRRYPSHVKEQLSEVAYFKYVPPNKIVARQDDVAKGLWFMLSGESVVYEKIYDKLTNTWKTSMTGYVRSGDMFGEVSVLHGVKRKKTIITTDHCEFLIIKRKDFDEVLRATVLAQWDDIAKCMALFTYFDDWDEITLRDGCLLSKINYYKTEELVLGEDYGDPKYVYFLIKGQCHVVEHVDMEVKHRCMHRRFRLIEQDQIERLLDQDTIDYSLGEESLLTQNDFPKLKDLPTKLSIYVGKTKRKKYFFQIATYNALSTFNIGEDLTRRFIMASQPSKILLIPRFWLVQRSKQIWSHIRQFLNLRIPRTRNIFEYFLQEKNWNRHKKDMVEEIQGRKQKANLNTIQNVPYSLRIEEDMFYYDCKSAEKRRYP